MENIKRVSTVLSEVTTDGLKYFIAYNEDFSPCYITEGYDKAVLVKVNPKFFVIKHNTGYDAYVCQQIDYRSCFYETDGSELLTSDEKEYGEKLWQAEEYKEDYKCSDINELSKSNEEQNETVDDYKEKVIDHQMNIEKEVENTVKKYEEKIKSIEDYYKKEFIRLTDELNELKSNNNNFELPRTESNLSSIDTVTKNELNRMRKLLAEKDKQIEDLKAKKCPTVQRKKKTKNKIIDSSVALLAISNMILFIIICFIL